MTVNFIIILLVKTISQISASVEIAEDDSTDFLEYFTTHFEKYCGQTPKEDCIINGIYTVVGFLCLIYISVILSLMVSSLTMGTLYNKNTADDKALCRLAILLSACCIVESTLLHHDDSQLYLFQCKCDGSSLRHALCQLGVSMSIITTASVLGCLAWSTGLCHGIMFIFFMTVSQTVSNLLSLFFITSSLNTLCNSSMQRLTRTFVMYSGNLLGILLVYIFRNNMQSSSVDAPSKSHKEKQMRMNADQSKRGHLKVSEDNTPEEKSHGYNKASHMSKYRWSRRRHPLSSRFGTDAFLPCVVLMKKKGRSTPPVAVNVVNIGLGSTKHHLPRHTHRRASLGVIKEQAGEEATWARLSQQRRTSLPTTFHSSRKQNVMSSVLVETSVLAELHTTLNELSIATGSSNIEVEECASRMRDLLKPYETENLCPSQVVWLHDSVSSTSEDSDDEDVSRGNRSISSKQRVATRRHDWSNSDGSVWTTTTSATGLPSQDPGPVKSKRLPKIQKTPSNTPHDSRCSSPISGKDGVGSLSRRRTIHSIGPLSSPGRPQTFFALDDNSTSKDLKDGRRSKSFSLFTSSDYESCDNLLTDGSEGETVKQLPDLQQPSAARRGAHEASPHEAEQSPKIRMLITEPTIDEGSEEEEKLGGSDNSMESNQSIKSSGSELSVQDEDYAEQLYTPDEITRIFEGDEYQTELLERVYNWNFPIFELADKTHCVLSQMGYKLFDDTGLFDTFKIPRKPFVDYMRALENGYRNIPYHNRIHASDVLHGCWFMTTQQIPGFCETSPLFSSDSSDSDSGTAHTQVNTVGNASLAQAIPALELMALYLAAAMHDYDHPGRTNAFLVETRHPLAMLYNDRSVLENHHASASWELLHSNLPVYDFLVNLDVAEWKRLRFLIVEAILATDLKKHFELMSRFSAKISRRTDTSSEATESIRQERCIKWTADEDRLLVCQMVIKLADIGGPTKIRDLHVTWTQAICQEFFTQGDEERQLNSPVSPFMDREQPQVAQLQRTFIKNLIAPLVCKMHRAGILAGYAEDNDVEHREEENILEPAEEHCSTVNCRSLIREQLVDNLRYWHAILQEEMTGHDEMNLVFKCCHKVTLEHENYNAIDSNFAKNLSENRRDKLQNHDSGKRVTSSTTEAKERHKNETKIPSFLRNYSSRPKTAVATDSNSTTSSALCNKTPDKNKSKLSNVYKKIP